MFTDRIAVLGTMHGKEQAIAPRLETSLGLQVIVPQDFDSDRFGTFTRNIKRMGTQIEAARAKALQAIELTGHDIGLASEGSFYPYPNFPIITCNREIVLWVDKKHNLEMIGQAISTDTNHAGQSITSVEEALSFAQKVGFPEHGLVVMSDRDSTTCEDICKGISDEKSLITIVEKTIDKKREIWIETDMRAMHNPTRMKAIELATDDLIRKLNSFCPRCSWPGFDVIEKKAGLPCRLCGFPTSMIRVEIFGCHQCGYQEQRPSADAGEKADPMYCEYCNP
jgi:hypothetical protein